MSPHRRVLWAVSAFIALASLAAGAPSVRDEGAQTIVEGTDYRVAFMRDCLDMLYEVRTRDGRWYPVTKTVAGLTFGYLRGPEVHQSNGVRATWALEAMPEAVVVGRQGVLDTTSGMALNLHFLCTDAGVLVGARLDGVPAGDEQGRLWSPPRLALVPGDWDGYVFWAADGDRHEGAIADLQPLPAYAGVSPWGPQGDTAPGLDPARPGLIVRSAARGVGFGVVFVDYPGRWGDSHSFLQRHTASSLYLYAGYSRPTAEEVGWAWLAPFPPADAADEEARVRELAASGERLVASFRPVAKPVPEEWARPLPDFPEDLRPRRPVTDINEAIVYSVSEDTASDYAVELARKTGSDALVRGWFKWAQAPPVAEWSSIPPRIHELGALFGGGITCSALYDEENGLSREQVLDMATRGPAGQLIDAWDTAGIRHGSLSSPAYLDYLFRWCREQIDAGVDYLFMDEHTAALSRLEGYDDHSLADFRRYLLEACPLTEGWAPGDARWRTELQIALDDHAICPTGEMGSFDYRGYLRAHDLLDDPLVGDNPLAGLWSQFRAYRDDRAWRALTDRIRAYAREKNRTVLISANGIARYVDLQVLGVWGLWRTDDGHISLADDQLLYWRSLVVQGHDVAGRKVPVVLFHDWGFGEPPFPWLAVAPSEREVWVRTRGAEIYAAGAFFAFPVLGPFGCDAGRDGTLSTMVKQMIFYRRHADVYLRSRWLGHDVLRANTDLVSLAAWQGQPGVILHVINRDVRLGELVPQREVVLRVPTSRPPDRITVVSPDFEGEREAPFRAVGDDLEVTLGDLEAYSVVTLHYPGEVDVSRLTDPLRVQPPARWTRPLRSEFRVLPDGSVEHATELEGFLQGMLHTQLRNPPTFLVNASGQAELAVHVRAVAALGARLEYRVDGEPRQTVELPDLDGKNDGAVAEYDKTFVFPIPLGRHRVTLDNLGGDWAVVSWYEFRGRFAD